MVQSSHCVGKHLFWDTKASTLAWSAKNALEVAVLMSIPATVPGLAFLTPATSAIFNPLFDQKSTARPCRPEGFRTVFCRNVRSEQWVPCTNVSAARKLLLWLHRRASWYSNWGLHISCAPFPHWKPSAKPQDPFPKITLTRFLLCLERCYEDIPVTHCSDLEVSLSLRNIKPLGLVRSPASPAGRVRAHARFLCWLPKHVFNFWSFSNLSLALTEKLAAPFHGHLSRTNHHARAAIFHYW